MIGIVAALGLGGYWLRRWIVPEFSGALARLADATIAVALLIVSLQILGTLSILRLGWIVALLHRRRPRARRCSAGARRRRATPRSRGPAGADARPPHRPRRRLLHRRRVDLPLAAQPRPGHVRRRHHLVPHALLGDGSPRSTRPSTSHFTDPLRLAAWFYPQSSELVHGAGIVLFKSDWLSPLINLFWLAIALLARLVRRPPLQGRPGDPGRGGDRARRGGDDRDPAGRGAQRHHGPRLPDRLRRLPDQRPPAPSAERRRGPGRSRARTRRCSTRGRWCWLGSPPGWRPRSSSPS